MKKSKTIKQTGYLVHGISDLTMWGGGNACIEMKSFVLSKTPTKKMLLQNINDNGFGVQSINGAICDIYRLYEYGVKEHLKTVNVGDISESTQDFYLYNF